MHRWAATGYHLGLWRQQTSSYATKVLCGGSLPGAEQLTSQTHSLTSGPHWHTEGTGTLALGKAQQSCPGTHSKAHMLEGPLWTRSRQGIRGAWEEQRLKAGGLVQIWLCYALTTTLGGSLPLWASVSSSLKPGGR